MLPNLSVREFSMERETTMATELHFNNQKQRIKCKIYQFPGCAMQILNVLNAMNGPNLSRTKNQNLWAMCNDLDVSCNEIFEIWPKMKSKWFDVIDNMYGATCAQLNITHNKFKKQQFFFFAAFGFGFWRMAKRIPVFLFSKSITTVWSSN